MYMVQLPQVKSHFKEARYFLPQSSQKFLVLILLTSGGWKEFTGFLTQRFLQWKKSADINQKKFSLLWELYETHWQITFPTLLTKYITEKWVSIPLLF